MTVFEAYITNLGKYAEGQFVGETLKFPATTEEVQSLLKNIGVDVQEAHAIPAPPYLTIVYMLPDVH